jgi:hypothetical protein
MLSDCSIKIIFMMIKKRMLSPKDPSQERKSKTFSKLNQKKKNKKKSIYAVYCLKIFLKFQDLTK